MADTRRTMYGAVEHAALAATSTFGDDADLISSHEQLKVARISTGAIR